MEKKNEIDRKATKGRKIKYIVHEKLLNFLQPVENLQALEAKDSILSNLFG
jgi:protein AATF/BFR2